MNTPGHLLVGAAVFAHPWTNRVLVAAFLGAILPDVSLVLMAGWAINVAGIAPQVVFDQLYFSDNWQRIFAIDNSFVVWGFLLVGAVLARSRIATAFSGAGFLHLVCDFLLHHDDARSHFWPITNWKFESPVSYWDSGHFGHEASIALLVISLISLVVLWRRFERIIPRLTFMGLAGFEAWVAVSWIRFF